MICESVDIHWLMLESAHAPSCFTIFAQPVNSLISQPEVDAICLLGTALRAHENTPVGFVTERPLGQHNIRDRCPNAVLQGDLLET